MGRFSRNLLTPVSIFLCTLSMFFLCANLVLAEDGLPEVSSDGLNLLEGKNVRVFYAKLGSDLAKYKKIKLLDCYVDFRQDWQKNYNLREAVLNGKVRDKDVDRIKAKLSAEFKLAFTETLKKAGYQVVDELDTDVLLLRPALLDVDINAPDVLSSRATRTHIRSAGSMTLYLELYESSTSILLARIIDPRADGHIYRKPATRTTNKIATDRIFTEWANILATNLAEFQAVSLN